ncbi:amidase [Micromonospora sp. WMMD712]|uniref:amidase family protein n=1 Tax=Micromonospora sp. WMMD712 TaxID=3016096 RepID=UPI002499CE51|nr:amidase [Micromonospora sp. WMMD712]WFE59508.1 amidase [Micromonospora sp. WMMD712]
MTNIQEPVRAVPESLTGPLSERVDRLRRGRLDGDRWRAEADEWAAYADGRYQACVELRPTGRGAGGVRIGVKDTLDVAGFATRLGLRHYRHHPRSTSAALSGLPRSAVVAKLVTTEINIGRGHGCVNPYFPHLDPAGSSTGCAVAVAAGICDVAVGTDSVGSVRLPAAACGVVGLRLTHDPRHFGTGFRSSPLLDAPGLVTRTARDLAWAWGEGWFGSGPPVPEQRAAFRVGVVAEVLEHWRAPEVVRAQDMAVRALDAAGHPVRRVRLGEIWRWRGAVFELCARHAWETCRTWPERVTESFGTPTRLALESGAAVTDERLADIVVAARRARAAAPALFEDGGVDVWLLPAGPRPPRNLALTPAPVSTIPDPNDQDDPRLVGYASIASLAGLPAVTFPVAHDEALDAPIEMQAVGPPGSEPTLIAFAETMSELLNGPSFRIDRMPSGPVAESEAGR